jgi:hypothetical protein
MFCQIMSHAEFVRGWCRLVLNLVAHTIEYGGMAEWLNAAVSKTVLPVIQVTRVRIPLPPPENLKRPEGALLIFKEEEGFEPFHTTRGRAFDGFFQSF